MYLSCIGRSAQICMTSTTAQPLLRKATSRLSFLCGTSVHYGAPKGTKVFLWSIRNFPVRTRYQIIVAAVGVSLSNSEQSLPDVTNVPRSAGRGLSVRPFIWPIRWSLPASRLTRTRNLCYHSIIISRRIVVVFLAHQKRKIVFVGFFSFFFV